MGKGIISCGLKIDGVHNRDIRKGDVVFMERGKKYEFYLISNKKYFDTEKTDFSSFIENAKWAYIMNSFFDSAIKKQKEEVYTEWGNFNEYRGEVAIPYLGIGNQYKQGSSIEFSFDILNNLWMGTGYRVEVFNEVPNDGLNFIIVPYIEKKIRYAYFVAPSKEIKMEQGKTNDEMLSYGMETFVTLSLHRFGISDLDKNPRINNYNIDLYLCDESGNILENNPILSEALSSYVSSPNLGNLNNKFRVHFEISDTWKNNYHPDKEPKKYSLEVHIVDKEEKNNNLTYNIAKEHTSIEGNSGDDEHNVKYSTQKYFMVKKFASDLILLTQQERTQMIQYIGDVEYNYREYDPCGYSKISIQELGNKDRPSPMVIFEEGKNESVIDKTHLFYDIIAGNNEDKVNKIQIKVEGLTVKEVLCNSILLDEGKHDDLHNVFQTGKIWTAKALKLSNNGIDYREDQITKIDNLRVHIDKTPILISEKQKDLINSNPESNYENEGVRFEKDDSHKGKTGEYDADYDMVPDHQIEGAGIQEWKENEDYVIKNQGQTATFTLQKLVYVYDKNLGGTVVQTKNSGFPEQLINSLWMFNYFWLNENHAQTYFLPISSCRYPNQVARIRVFPEISWTFHLNYGMKNPFYYRDTWVEMRQHRVEDAFNKGQSGDMDGYDGTLENSFKLALECNWNRTEKAKLDQKIAKNLKLFVGSFIKMKNFVRKVTGDDKEKSTAGLSTNLLERVKRTPLSIEIVSPQLGIAAGWEFEHGMKEKNENHIVASTINLKIKASPLVGAQATIDLIAWGKKLHPAAQAVITALDLLTYAANAEVRFDLIFYGKLMIEGDVELSSLKKSGQLKAEGQFGFELILLAKAVLKLQAFFYELDIDFEARATASGYFSAGLSLGLDNYKGLYFEPIVRHSGIKVTLIYKVVTKGKERSKKESFVIIKAGKAELDKKYYINA